MDFSHCSNVCCVGFTVKETDCGGLLFVLCIAFRLLGLYNLHAARGIFKKCVNSQAVYPLSEQHGLEAQERR